MRATLLQECVRRAQSLRQPSDLARSSPGRVRQAAMLDAYNPDHPFVSPHKKSPERLPFRAMQKCYEKTKSGMPNIPEPSHTRKNFSVCSSSSIQTVLSASEFHRIMRRSARGLYRRWGIASLRAHPALKIIYSLITFIIRLHPQHVKMVRDHFHIVSAMNNRYQGDTS